MLTMNRAQIAADCRAAADVIERNGWHQGSFFVQDFRKPPQDCAVCAGGALNIAIHGMPWGSGLMKHVLRYNDAFTVLSAYVDDPAGSVALWNDEPGRTAEEVTAALRGLADKLEAEAAE
jgi:hypothetical protein